MTKRVQQDYFRRGTAEVAAFTENLRANAVTSAGTLDSAAADDFIANVSNQTTGVTLPEKLGIVLEEAGPKNRDLILGTLLDGIREYETQHGVSVPADVVEQAIQSAYSTSYEARRKYQLPVFDSANSGHSDTLALQPNRAVVAILAMMSEAIPFVHYLPADIGSNQAKLAILQHEAGSDYGQYDATDILDGISGGDIYVTSSRLHKCTVAADGTFTGKLTKIQTDEETCDANAGNLKLLRGRSIVYVNGQVAALEVNSNGSGASALSGSVTLNGTPYAIAGTINTDTGVIAGTTTPAIPTTTPIVVEGFIDYERDPDLTPSIITHVNTFDLYASPWRVKTRQSIDARTQMANELGLDAYGESVLAIQQQFANERHYKVLAMARRLAANNQQDFDFAWPTMGAQKKRADVFQDFATPLGAVDQQMANDTMNHGVTHLYVGKFMAAMLLSMPRDIFEPSGVPARPGIYRLGRLFGRFEVYYAPKRVAEAMVSGHQSAQVLCIGRATDVTRNPFVLGDAVAPSVFPLNVGDDFKSGAGFYARNFTAVNPHGPSALGCAMINITNLT